MAIFDTLMFAGHLHGADHEILPCYWTYAGDNIPYYTISVVLPCWILQQKNCHSESAVQQAEFHGLKMTVFKYK